MDLTVPCDRDFDHPPSSEEVLDFTNSVMWEWELQEENGGFLIDPGEETAHSVEGFRYIDGRVCLRNWRKRTGADFKYPVPKEYIRQNGLSENN